MISDYDSASESLSSISDDYFSNQASLSSISDDSASASDISSRKTENLRFWQINGVLKQVQSNVLFSGSFWIPTRSINADYGSISDSLSSVSDDLSASLSSSASLDSISDDYYSAFQAASISNAMGSISDYASNSAESISD